LWDLISSPSSRLSTRMKTVSPTYRLSAQAGVVSLVAFDTAGDLTKFVDADKGVEVGSPVLLAIQSVAWLGIIIALGSMMLGYLRLPDGAPSRGEKRAKEVETFEQSHNTNVAHDTPVQHGNGTDLSLVAQRIETLVSM